MSSRRTEKEQRRAEGLAMTFAVAATAWDQRLGCRTMNDRVFDAVGAFRGEYIDTGSQVVP